MALFDDIAYPPAPSEEQIRDEILADLGERRREVLDWLRRRLVVIYKLRCFDVGIANAWVTADDARRIIDADERFSGVNRNFLGALFKVPGWRSVGFHKSETAGSHANRLMRWVWEGE